MPAAFARQRMFARYLALGLGLVFLPLSAARAMPESFSVAIDEAKLVKLPDRVSSIVVGNPLIADVTLQPGGIVVVTGKGYGATNMIALDRSGATLLEKSIQVVGPRDKVVVVYRGALRETYSCAPECQQRITLGDAPAYFDAVLGQTGSRNSQAQGATK